MKIYHLQCGSHTLSLGGDTLIMGILNVTPDSFSDGGCFSSLDAAVDRAEQMVSDGAHIIDIGGESSRPFSDPVSVAEEIRRVVPVIEKLIKRRISVPISVDTTKAAVAESALAAGACIINDISALAMDPRMGAVAAAARVPVVLMHMRGTPKTMQVAPTYANLIDDIKQFLGERVQTAVAAGIAPSQLVLDPGIGFGKTVDHNLSLIRHLDRFVDLGLPLLIGPSRKSFIRNILQSDRDREPTPADIETGTQAAVAAAVLNNVHIVRVHDVARTRATLALMNRLKVSGCPPDTP